MRYAVLQVASFYPDLFGTATRIYPDIKVTLEYVTPLFFSLFRSHYAGKYITAHMGIVMVSHFCVGHQCKFPGCGTVLVVDGNMKNRRDVCKAKDAGYIEFLGLPGINCIYNYTLYPIHSKT